MNDGTAFLYSSLRWMLTAMPKVLDSYLLNKVCNPTLKARLSHVPVNDIIPFPPSNRALKLLPPHTVVIFEEIVLQSNDILPTSLRFRRRLPQSKKRPSVASETDSALAIRRNKASTRDKTELQAWVGHCL
jgi:hypothetical protein